MDQMTQVRRCSTMDGEENSSTSLSSMMLSLTTLPAKVVAKVFTKPRTFFKLFSIRHTIILVDSNLNMIQGDHRHMDRSTTITNRDSFNIESTVTEQQLLPTTSLAVDGDSDGKVVIGS